MKIHVALTIDLDPADWELAFGVSGPQAIRQDVKEYILHNVIGGGVFGNGEVDATIRLA